MAYQTRQDTRKSQDRAARASSFRPPGRAAREFGVGYGSSSGYASPRRYVESQSTPQFRCA